MYDDAGVPRVPSFVDEYQSCPDCGTSLWVLTRSPREAETAPRKLFCGACNQTFIAPELKYRPDLLSFPAA
jgi:hypothetical protein